jgi:hypothetical protein
MWRRAPVHSRRPNGTAPFVVLALLLAGALSGGLHFVLVPHEICADHGEAVEVGPEPKTPSESPLPSSSHAHDHCSAAQASGILAPLGPSLALAPPVHPAYDSTPAAGPRVVSPIETLRLAPKNSPPA